MDVESTDPVVVAVDMPEGAPDAVGSAADLAATWGSPLRLVHVVDPGRIGTQVPACADRDLPTR